MSAQLGITVGFLQQETVSYRRVSWRGFRDQSGGWRIGVRGRIEEVWNLKTMFSQLAKRSTRILASGIFKQLRTFVVVPDVSSKFSKIGNVFFFRWSVRCQHQLKLYSIERNDGQLLCAHHWSWAQWVSKTICQNCMGFSYIFSWSCQVWLLAPPFFPNASTSSVKRRKLIEK